MDGLLTEPTDVIQRDSENPFLHIQKADFPVTLYDRPSLAFSNLLLRGDVDAATRAIFAPQTLTPAEMKSFSGELLKGKDNPLLRTVTDIFTNPLVILGVIMALKYPMTGKTHQVFEVGKGLMKSAPGPVGSYVQSAFANLRNIPGAFRTLASWARETGNFMFTHGEALNDSLRKVGRISPDGWLRVSAHLQGFHKAEKAGVPIVGGTRMTLQKVYGLRKGKPVWPGLQGLMSKEEKSAAQLIRNWYNKIWKNVATTDKGNFEKFRETMAVKGTTGAGGKTKIGEWLADYFPISARYSHLEGTAVYNQLRTKKSYHFGMQKVREWVAGALKKRQGITLGRLQQLRQMEKLGMPPIVDDAMREIARGSTTMEGVLRKHWAGVAGIRNPAKRAEVFAARIIDHMKKSKMNIRARLGSGNIAEGALGQASHLLGSAAAKSPQRFSAQIKSLASTIMEPAQYDMRPIQAARRYLSTVSSSYTWHIAKGVNPTLGTSGVGFKSVITPLINTAKGMKGFQHAYLSDQLVPLMRGLKPYNTYKRAASFGHYKSKAYEWLTTHELPKKLLNPGSQEWLKRYFSDFSSLSSESLGAKLSSFFYVSTLGLNISPASKNLLQNYITLLHVPGINATGFREGMREMTKGIGKYAEYLKGGMGKEAAWGKAFPDYVKAVGKGSGMTKAMVAGDIGREGALTPVALGSFWEKIKSGMLMPFSASESFNRLFGFYIGKHSHLAAGAKMAEATEFGAMINHICHFPGGPLGMPRALLGVWPPLRQFMHFPLRYAGFLAGTPTLTGAKGLAQLRPLATAAGASAAAYTAMKNLLGIDLSQGLLMGALPLPQYGQAAFHPWPLVPPAVSIAGAAAKAIHSGETEDVGRTAALMAPSGIALRRLYKTLGPKYAQYKNRLPDGRIPVYNDRNALIGAYTPWQLTLRSLGLSPTSQQAEYGAAKWLLTQREKVRAYRREYLEALSENDIDGAERVNREFQKAYPELGPLQLKKTDISAVRNRREISRLNRILRGFPKSYQPLFSHMISQASLSEMTQNIEAEPSTLQTFLPLTGTLQ